jgi:predicted nuclease of predicted toxin-antitoxin system
VRFFLDEDLSGEVAQIARNLGLDVCSVHEVNREKLDDSEQFDYAIEHDMVMLYGVIETTF